MRSGAAVPNRAKVEAEGEPGEEHAGLERYYYRLAGRRTADDSL